MLFNSVGMGFGVQRMMNRSEELEIETFVNNSELLFSIFQIVDNQTLGKGYTFLFENLFQHEKTTKEFQEYVIDHLWVPQTKKAIIQVLCFGYYVVQYVRITKKDNMPPEFIGDFYPMVLSKEDYHMGWVKNTDLSRTYFAFEADIFDRIKPSTLFKKIPNTRVFIVHEPTWDGHIQSPVQKILPILKSYMAMWSNMIEADRQRSFPLMVFTNTISNRSVRSGVTNSSLPQVYTMDNNASAMEEQMILQRTRVMENFAMEDRLRQYERNTPQSLMEEIDPISGHRITRYMNQPFNGSLVVPDGFALSQAPKPEPLPQFETKIELLISQISTTLGVAVDMIHQKAKGKQFASDDRLTLKIMASAVSSHQKWIAHHLQIMYMDIYAKSYRRKWKVQHESMVRESVKKGNKTLTSTLRDQNFLNGVKNSFKLAVQFYTHPIVSLKDLQEMKRTSVIGQEKYNDEVLKVYGMSEDIALSPAQNLSEVKKRKALLTSLGVDDEDAAYAVASEITGLTLTPKPPVPPAPQEKSAAPPATTTTSVVKKVSKKPKEPSSTSSGKGNPGTSHSSGSGTVTAEETTTSTTTTTTQPQSEKEGEGEGVKKRKSPEKQKVKGGKEKKKKKKTKK